MMALRRRRIVNSLDLSGATLRFVLGALAPCGIVPLSSFF